MSDPNKKRQVRRQNHIAKDLRTPKYREKSIPKALVEDEDKRRQRRYGLIDDFEPWHPMDKDDNE